MKIYNITSIRLGCVYVRQLIPMWENGYNGDVVGLATPKKETKTIVKEAMEADIVVFHRPEMKEHWEVAKRLKEMGKKIVFDNDDTFHLHKGHPFHKMHSTMGLSEKYDRNLKRLNKITDYFIKNADLVTTTTKTLAKEYKELNDNVVVLPNCVYPDDWEEPVRNEGDKVRIAISGSAAYSSDFEVIKDYIKELDERDDVQFILFGMGAKDEREENPETEKIFSDEYKFWDTLKNKEHAPWVKIHKYFDILNELKIDIILIPRKENHFNKCKSNLKFLEAAMCEIPVVASSFPDGPYEELDGEIGIKLTGDWKETVDELIKNKEKRRAIGKRAKEYVLENYDIAKHAHKWEEVYNKLI